MEKFISKKIDSGNIYGGAICTGGESSFSHSENSWGIGSIYKKRNVYITHDGDSVSDDGIITYENKRLEYGDWYWN